jgi:putative transposase
MSRSADARRRAPGYRRRIARKRRSELPASGLFHVTNRGVARCEIFRDDLDRQLFVASLRRIAERFGWKDVLYCLMTTHFHLLVPTSLADLSTGMHRLQAPYAQGFNLKYARVGHLFQERFHARAVTDELGFARIHEYIRNNPVAAGLCAKATDWPWTGSF